MAGGAARLALPPQFRSARCVVQLSSSAGIEPDLRAAPVVLARSPDRRRRAEALAQGRAASTSGLQPVQTALHRARRSSTASTIPAIERLALLPGYAEVAVPDLPDPERPRAAFVADRNRQRAPPRRREAYANACLRRLALAPEGRRHNTCVAVSCRLLALPRPACSIPSASPGRSRASCDGKGGRRTSPKSTRSSSGPGRPSGPKDSPMADDDQGDTNGRAVPAKAADRQPAPA